MNGFQIVTLAVIAAIAGFVLVAVVNHRMSFRAGSAWLTLWIASGAAIARPELTVVVARAMGIRRGADLVLYLGILAMFVGFFAVYVRLRKLEATITQIVRHVAVERPMELERMGEASRSLRDGD